MPQRFFRIALAECEVGDPEAEFVRVRLAQLQQVFIALLRLVQEPLVVDTPADELREAGPGQAHRSVLRVLVAEELPHPHRLVEPPVVHVDSEEPQVGVPDPVVAPPGADPTQEVPGDALVLLGLHLGGPSQVEVEHGGGEQVVVELAGAAAKPVEILLGLVAQPIDRKRHARAERGREVTAPVHREREA